MRILRASTSSPSRLVILIAQQARDIVARSSGLEQTRALAQDYADRAIDAISGFPHSEAKDGLIEMCAKTMNRRK